MSASTFRETVAAVAARAKAILPASTNGRLEGAVKLVLAYDVEPQADGTILVGSCTDPLKTYRLVGTACECKDFTDGKAPEGWCRHRIAAGIAKRVHQEMAPRSPDVETEVEMPADFEPYPDNDHEEVPPAHSTPGLSEPVPLPLPEAAFSLTLKGTIDGHEALLTARGQTAAEFQANLAAIKGLLDPRPQPQVPVNVQEPQGPGWCAVHHVPMQENLKEGRTWWSHRLPEGGFCKGR